MSSCLGEESLAQNARARVDVLDDGDKAILRVAGLPSPGPGRVYQVWRKQPGAKVPKPTDALFSVSRDGTATVDVPGGVEGVVYATRR